MKTRDLFSLTALVVGAALLLGACQNGNQRPKTSAAEQMSPEMKSFYSSLSADGQRKFDKLDPQHKNMAMDMAKSGQAKSADEAVDAQYNSQMKDTNAPSGKVSSVSTTTTAVQ